LLVCTWIHRHVADILCLSITQGVAVRPEAPPSELAVAVARHFEQLEVDEEDCIGGFLEQLENGTGVTEYARNTFHFDGGALQPAVRKRKRTKLAARPGEQVGIFPPFRMFYTILIDSGESALSK
jgi:hypothetical protein